MAAAAPKITFNDLPYPVKSILAKEDGKILALLMYNEIALDPETNELRVGPKAPRKIFQRIIMQLCDALGVRCPVPAQAIMSEWGTVLKNVCHSLLNAFFPSLLIVSVIG